MFRDFQISKKYQDSAIVKFFENPRRSQLFWTRQIKKTKKLKISSACLMSDRVNKSGNLDFQKVEL